MRNRKELSNGLCLAFVFHCPRFLSGVLIPCTVLSSVVFGTFYPFCHYYFLLIYPLLLGNICTLYVAAESLLEFIAPLPLITTIPTL